MKKYLLLLGLISIVFISACAQQPTQPAAQPIALPAVIAPAEEPTAPIQAETPVPGQDDVEEMVVTDTVKEFDIVAKQWEFTPATITVNEGDQVKLNIQNIDVTHGFAIFEFGVNERLTPGQTTTVEFTADRAGEYTFLCTVPCGRGHRDMKGMLIVE